MKVYYCTPFFMIDAFIVLSATVSFCELQVTVLAQWKRGFTHALCVGESYQSFSVDQSVYGEINL